MAIIRAVNADDLPLIESTLAAAAGAAYDGDVADLAHGLSKAINGNAASVITLGPAGELWGLALVLIPDVQVAELVALWTEENHRRRGLARAMLAAFRPVWRSSTITAVLPAKCEPAVVGALLDQFAFKPVRGDERTWKTTRVRRTTGRSSLAPSRHS